MCFCCVITLYNPIRLTVRRGGGGTEGARNGKGNQDIEVCKKLAF